MAGPSVLHVWVSWLPGQCPTGPRGQLSPRLCRALFSGPWAEKGHVAKQSLGSRGTRILLGVAAGSHGELSGGVGGCAQGHQACPPRALISTQPSRVLPEAGWGRSGFLCLQGPTVHRWPAALQKGWGCSPHPGTSGRTCSRHPGIQHAPAYVEAAGSPRLRRSPDLGLDLGSSGCRGAAWTRGWIPGPSSCVSHKLGDFVSLFNEVVNVRADFAPGVKFPSALLGI